MRAADMCAIYLHGCPASVLNQLATWPKYTGHFFIKWDQLGSCNKGVV